MASKMNVAVLGAGGTMGFAMARNLARADYAVRAWNRSLEKAQPLSEDGAQVLETAAETVQGADVILTMLADADTVIDCMTGDGGVLSGEPADDVIWLQMSTIGEEGTARCAELARDRELEFVDCPVLGTKQPAEDGKLVILASGPERVQDRLTPVLEAVGQRTTLKLAAKDAGLVQAAAKARGLDLPVLEAIRRRMEQALPDHGDEDLSATFLTSAGESAAA